MLRRELEQKPNKELDTILFDSIEVLNNYNYDFEADTKYNDLYQKAEETDGREDYENLVYYTVDLAESIFIENHPHITIHDMKVILGDK